MVVLDHPHHPPKHPSPPHPTPAPPHPTNAGPDGIWVAAARPEAEERRHASRVLQAPVSAPFRGRRAAACSTKAAPACSTSVPLTTNAATLLLLSQPDRELEKELGVKVVDVEVDSDEDAAAVRLINTAAGLTQLLLSDDRLTREMFVFGWVARQPPSPPQQQQQLDGPQQQVNSQQQPDSHHEQQRGVFILGIIDELRLTQHPQRPAPEVTVVERKTRQSRAKPGNQQIAQSRLQTMVYCRLLGQLAAASHPDALPALCAALGGLDAGKQLSKQVVDEAKSMFRGIGSGSSGSGSVGSGIDGGSAGGLTLADTVRMVHEMAARLLHVSEHLEVIWEAQEDASVIWTDRFKLHPRWLASCIQSSAAFWEGAAAPCKVMEEEAEYKCGWCAFLNACDKLPSSRRVPPEELF